VERGEVELRGCVAMSPRFALPRLAAPHSVQPRCALSVVVSHLVVRLDVQLDLFAGQGADSVGGKDWSADGWHHVCFVAGLLT
jgi:hypothetical protein